MEIQIAKQISCGLVQPSTFCDSSAFTGPYNHMSPNLTTIPPARRAMVAGQKLWGLQPSLPLAAGLSLKPWLWLRWTCVTAEQHPGKKQVEENKHNQTDSHP